MKIGIVGAGNLGTALVKRLRPQGHDMMLSYSRDLARLANIAQSMGAAHGSVQQTVRWGEVVALTVPWGSVPDALGQAGDLSGKIIWDCTNALKPDMSGLAIGTTTSGGEEISKLAAGARVVKGIPPFAEILHSEHPTVDGRPVDVFVAGDDLRAKQVVASLLTALPASVTDAGGLEAARLIEPAMMLLVRLAYAMKLGPRIALRLDREG